MIVVPVLMISCHVSENSKSGPLNAQRTTVITHRKKVIGRPVAWPHGPQNLKMPSRTASGFNRLPSVGFQSHNRAGHRSGGLERSPGSLADLVEFNLE
jgi:hypothetical protein